MAILHILVEWSGAQQDPTRISIQVRKTHLLKHSIKHPTIATTMVGSKDQIALISADVNDTEAIKPITKYDRGPVFSYISVQRSLLENLPGFVDRHLKNAESSLYNVSAKAGGYTNDYVLYGTSLSRSMDFGREKTT